MPRTRLNPRLAKTNRTYTVEEAARLWGLSRGTVRAWLKSGKLAAIDDQRPALIHGRDLRAFHEQRRASAKSPCLLGHLYCLRCRAPRRPALAMADYAPRAAGAGDLKALCEACGALMHRRTRQDQIGVVLPDVAVRITQGQPRLADSPDPSLNPHSKRDRQS